MTVSRPNRPRDPAQLAKLMVDIATGEMEDRAPQAGALPRHPRRSGRLRPGARHSEPHAAGSRPAPDLHVLPRTGRGHKQRLRARPPPGGDSAQEHQRLPRHVVRLGEAAVRTVVATARITSGADTFSTVLGTIGA